MRIFLSFFLLVAATAQASLIVNCPIGVTACGVIPHTETTVGNIATVEIGGSLSSTFGPVAATISFIRDVITGGPIRPGKILLSMVVDGDYGAHAATSGTGMFGSFSCSGSAQVGHTCYLWSLQSVTLGQAIPIQINIALSRGTSNPGLLDGGYRTLWVQALFFEDASGLAGAPVSVTFTPEPGALWMGAGGLALIAIFRRRHFVGTGHTEGIAP